MKSRKINEYYQDIRVARMIKVLEINLQTMNDWERGELEHVHHQVKPLSSDAIASKGYMVYTFKDHVQYWEALRVCRDMLG